MAQPAGIRDDIAVIAHHLTIPASILVLATLAACGTEPESVQQGTVSGAGDTTSSDALADGGHGDDTTDTEDAAPGTNDGNDAADSADNDAGTDVGQVDAGPPKPEICGNFADDNGNGLIDEGCLVGPILMTTQTWLDLGMWQIKPSDTTGPRIKLPHDGKRRSLVVARDMEATKSLVVGDYLQGADSTVHLGGGDWAEAAGRSYGWKGAGTVLIGGSDAQTMTAGTWEIGLRRTQSITNAGPSKPLAGWLNIGVLQAAAPKAMMALHLDVYVVGEQPMPIETLKNSAFWQKTLTVVSKILNPAGLALGQVSLTAIDGTDGKTFRHVDNIGAVDQTNELPALFALSGKLKPKSPRVPVFLVATLNNAGQPAAKGITGQIGGVNGLAGHMLGGIAISMHSATVNKFLKADPSGQTAAQEYGRTLAHELGHLLGLWHATESDGQLHDTITDTEQCALPEGHQFVTAQDCPDAAKNLMFPSAAGTELSQGQRAVIVRHPFPQ